jgi:hypothetical protein
MIPENIAVYIGEQESIAPHTPLKLYNLLVPLGDHPVGSTVTDTTILKLIRA